MSILDDVRLARKRMLKPRAWPVGKGALIGFEESHGHDTSEFAPEEYGEYAATSNEIYSVIQLRARLMSSLELGVFHGAGAEKTDGSKSPAAALLRHINPFWTPRRLARMDELSMSLWGESYWAIERRRGVPSEIFWMKPSRVKPVPHASGYIQGFLYESVTGERLAFRPDEVVWFRYPNPIDEFSPLSPLAAARLAADTAKSMMTSNNKLFANGLQMGGIVAPATDKVSFSKEQAEDLSALLERRFKGVDKAHTWAVLRFEAQMKAMNLSPKDAEFLAGLNMSLRQVCNAYGMPSPLLNDLEHATLSNLRDLMRAAWENTLVSDSQLRADEIREQFLPLFKGGPDHCEYDYTKVPSLQEAASDVWSRDRQAIEVGLLTINEVRKRQGLPPVPWGDVYWCPVNKSAVSSADDHPEGANAKPDTDMPDPPETADERAFRQILADLRRPVLNGRSRP